MCRLLAYKSKFNLDPLARKIFNSYRFDFYFKIKRTFKFRFSCEFIFYNKDGVWPHQSDPFWSESISVQKSTLRFPFARYDSSKVGIFWPKSGLFNLDSWFPRRVFVLIRLLLVRCQFVFTDQIIRILKSGQDTHNLDPFPNYEF